MRNVSLPNEELLPEMAKMLSGGSGVSFKAKGVSMLPFIVGGRDIVELRRKDCYVVGDIVLAEVLPKHFILHRIVKVNGDDITLMGDGNIKGTEHCQIDGICGYATTIIKKETRIDCNSSWERRKAWMWRALLPVRPYLLAVYKRCI